MNTHIVPTIERAENGELTVSSLTVAEGSGVEHRAVLQLIMKRTLELEQFGQVAFEMRAGYNNAQVRVALLNEPQATLLMSFQKNTAEVIAFKVALVKGFFEMAEQIKNAPALSDDQIVAQALQITSAKVLALESKIEVDAPKVGYVDLFVADGDAMSFRTVASTVRINESKLRALLIACEWIYKEESERWSESQQAKEPQTRYSEYAAHKLNFIRKQEHKVPRFRGEVMHTLKITPQGGNSIARLINRAVEKFGDLDMAIKELESQRLERIASRKNNTKELF